jgi:molybdenum cofactor biosynthesis enzyme MoaA
VNEDDIVPMALLAREQRVTVRFIEEMPFNGSVLNASDTSGTSGTSGTSEATLWTAERIEERLKGAFPTLLRRQREVYSTAETFTVEGWQGNIGIIAGFSRTFCGDCNRIRLTAKGILKTCLYDTGALDVKHILRGGADNEELHNALVGCIAHRFKDGHEAEQAMHEGFGAFESMSAIGG